MPTNLFPPTNYLDFHTHQPKRQDNPNITEITSIHLGQTPKHDFYTIGKHPWWTENILSEEEKETLKKHLSSPKCLAMGEMGLDNLKGVAMPLQMDILRSQLDLAQELERPVIIHCVRAIDQLLQIKKEYPSIQNWCIHGYARHEILALQLIDKGFHLSLMPVSKPNEKYQKLLSSLPLDRFFLETDSMPEIQIEAIYLQAAEVLGITIEALQIQLIHNAELFFKK